MVAWAAGISTSGLDTVTSCSLSNDNQLIWVTGQTDAHTLNSQTANGDENGFIVSFATQTNELKHTFFIDGTSGGSIAITSIIANHLNVPNTIWILGFGRSQTEIFTLTPPDSSVTFFACLNTTLLNTPGYLTVEMVFTTQGGSLTPTDMTIRPDGERIYVSFHQDPPAGLIDFSTIGYHSDFGSEILLAYGENENIIQSLNVIRTDTFFTPDEFSTDNPGVFVNYDTLTLGVLAVGALGGDGQTSRMFYPSLMCDDPKQYGPLCQYHNYYITSIRYRPIELNSSSIGYDFYRFQYGEDTPPYKVNQDEGHTEYVPLPFPFRFYGDMYLQLQVDSNGWLKFGAEISSGEDDNDMGLYLQDKEALGILAFLWYDIDFAHIETQLITEPDRRFVIEFTGQYYFCVDEGLPDCPPIKIQIHLVESDHHIEVHYMNVEYDPSYDANSKVTIGIINLDGDRISTYYPYDSSSKKMPSLTHSSFKFSATTDPVCMAKDSSLIDLLDRFPTLLPFPL